MLEKEAIKAERVERARVVKKAWKARMIAEGRCPHCGKLRPDDDKEKRLCAKCRADDANRHNAKYARAHAENPPDFAHNPGRPFRYGKTRLDNPRQIVLTLDDETYEYIKLCRQHYCLSPAYEPYQVGEVIRRLLSLLGDAPEPIPDAPRGLLPRFTGCGLSLNFYCDRANYARIIAHQKACCSNRSSAVRVCIQHAAQYALTLSDEEAKRRLWPGYAELPSNPEI